MFLCCYCCVIVLMLCSCSCCCVVVCVSLIKFNLLHVKSQPFSVLLLFLLLLLCYCVVVLLLCFSVVIVCVSLIKFNLLHVKSRLFSMQTKKKKNITEMRNPELDDDDEHNFNISVGLIFSPFFYSLDNFKEFLMTALQLLT